ncbi:WG repeat-containing protein [Clostridium sp.]|uniref:WG repeat-containing protein n=1 Tax=Clostridium sp. TaxID=1506 RepID=UPI0032164815
MKILNKIFLILLLISCVLLSGCNGNAKYEDACPFNEGLAAVKLRDLWGFIDTEENLVITPYYDEAYAFYNNIALVKKDGLWGAIDKKNNVIIPFKYEEANLASDTLISVKKKNKYGCIDLKNNIVVDFISDSPISLYKYNNKNIATITKDNLHGFIDLDTNLKVEPKYSSVMPIFNNNSMVYLESNGKFGFVNLDSKTIIEPKYPCHLNFNDDMSPVYIDGKLGYINTEDELVIDPIYENADPFYNGLAVVRLNGKAGCIDKSGNVIVPFIYDYINSFFENNISIVSLNNKVALINNKGELLFEPKFQHIDLNSENDMFAASYEDDDGNYKKVFINKQGEIILSTDYTEIYPFFNGFASIYKSSKCGILASNGMEIVPPIYDEVRPIDSLGNSFQVCLGGKWGFIDKNQKEILKCEYDTIDSYPENMFIVTKDNKYGLFNKSSNKFTDTIYDEIKFSYEDNAPIAVKLDNQWFYIDKNGNKLK